MALHEIGNSDVPLVGTMKCFVMCLQVADDRERYVDLDLPIDIDSGWRNISLPQRMIEIGQKTLLPFEQVDGFCFIFSSLDEH